MRPQLADAVLMVRPACFEFNRQTAGSNAFQRDLELDETRLLETVQLEFDRFVDRLILNGVSVLVAEDTDDTRKPDAIFPNNWLTMHRDGTLRLYPMQAVNRRSERSADVLEMIADYYQCKSIIDLSAFEETGVYLEGTGSMVFDHANKIVYACYSPRTNRKLFEQVAADMGYRPVGFNANDSKGQAIYHTNVMMGIGEGFAVVCPDSITHGSERESVVNSLEAVGIEIISISMKQMEDFAGNVLALRSSSGDQLLVLSKRAHASLSSVQLDTIEKYAKCLPMDISTIENIGGGSARCMLAEIFLPLGKGMAFRPEIG